MHGRMCGDAGLTFTLFCKEIDLFAVDVGKLQQLDNIDPPVPRLAAGHVILGLAELGGNLRLGESRSAAGLPQAALHEAICRRALGHAAEII